MVLNRLLESPEVEKRPDQSISLSGCAAPELSQSP